MKFLAALMIGLLALPPAAYAGKKTEIRFYKVNKHAQQERVALVRGVDEPGCHNFILNPKVHRVAQIGFKSCTLYSESDCETGSELSVSWKRKKKPTTSLTPGARWFLAGERGTKVASWRCEREPRRDSETNK